VLIATVYVILDCPILVFSFQMPPVPLCATKTCTAEQQITVERSKRTMMGLQQKMLDDSPITFSQYSDYSNESARDIEVIFKRFWEIFGVVGKDLMIPLGYSFLVLALTDEAERSEISFWDHQSGYSVSNSKNVTNAERVSLALEALGPTFVKFGQALSSRGDIIGTELSNTLSSILQDNMSRFGNDIAINVILEELLNDEEAPHSADVYEIISSLSSEPVAAASVGQVYKAYLSGYGYVAIKVKRPGIRDIVEADAQLLRVLANIAEAIPEPGIDGKKLVKTELVNGVNEFMTRLFEEMDYEREMRNAIKFAGLYEHNVGTARYSLPEPFFGEDPGVIVPKMIPSLCSENVLTMTWVEGKKLTDVSDSSSIREREENMRLLVQGIQCTLSQILETGVMHADPHGGNLLKAFVPSKDGRNEIGRLAYIDFGILADIPMQVRDGLVCAVSYLIFQRNIGAVAALFGELLLIPAEVMNDQEKLNEFSRALEEVADEVLEYSDDEQIPSLQFDRLLFGLAGLIPRFQFQLPPYFLNNARALGTLEGMAKAIDPRFNILTVVYPFALQRLLKNPSGSKIVDKTLKNLVCNGDGTLNRTKASQLLQDASSLTGIKRRHLIRDVLMTKNGRKIAKEIGWIGVKKRLTGVREKRQTYIMQL